MSKLCWNPFIGEDRLDSNALEQQNLPKPLINAVYYPSWRVYRQQPPSSLNLDYITHIYHAFARSDWVIAGSLQRVNSFLYQIEDRWNDMCKIFAS